MSAGSPAQVVDAAATRARWQDSLLAAVVFAVAPNRIGGIVVRSQCGPVRDRWFAALRDILPSDLPQRRIPVDVTEGRLIGGIDLAATLAQGQTVAERGLLADADGGVIVLPSAERCERIVLAAVAMSLDDGVVRVERDGVTAVNAARVGVIALDESREDEAPLATLLSDRLAIVINLDGIALKDAPLSTVDVAALKLARLCVHDVLISDRDLEAICGLSLALGISSLRAPVHAMHVAQASAALNGRFAIEPDDLEAAVRLVLVPRATQFPSNAEQEPQSQPENQPPPDSAPEPPADQANTQPSDAELEDMLLEAAKAVLPVGLLDTLQRAASLRKSKSQSGRSGAVRLSRSQRGRRAGSRRGDPRAGGCLDILETIRAAAPWQVMRKRERQQRVGALISAPRLEVRRDDFRMRRFKHQSETATIFVVDASGSAALNRLAEAKGAVELLLADCYARRDHVALIAFRGKRADLLLPPTRSLVRAKRCLAGLPGGGGTPLAIATDEACLLAQSVQRKGQSPTLVFLTDGRANINRSGAPGRAAAQTDAHAAALALKVAGIPTIVIDTSSHAGQDSQKFAEIIGATYLPLPYANASSLSTAIRHVVG